MTKIYVLSYLPKYAVERLPNVQFCTLGFCVCVVAANQFEVFQCWKCMDLKDGLFQPSFFIDWETNPREENTFSKFAQLFTGRGRTRTFFLPISGAWLPWNSYTGYWQSTHCWKKMHKITLISSLNQLNIFWLLSIMKMVDHQWLIRSFM